jgi:multidrug efflux pump subunit AcrA (membrane-fusion protein)
MQPYLAPAASFMTCGIAIHEGNADQLVEVDAKLSRTLDRPVSSRQAAVPKMPPRERYSSNSAAMIVSRRMMPSSAHPITIGHLPVAGQVVKIAVKDNQRVQRGQLLLNRPHASQE